MPALLMSRSIVLNLDLMVSAAVETEFRSVKSARIGMIRLCSRFLLFLLLLLPSASSVSVIP